MTTHPIASPSSIAVPAAGGIWAGFVGRLLATQRALVSRQLLLEMDGRMLKDIGITHGQAVAEARRMPWDVAPAPRPR
jgi:uncharacterized protein YjiS (DUF1127 family)